MNSPKFGSSGFMVASNMQKCQSLFKQIRLLFSVESRVSKTLDFNLKTEENTLFSKSNLFTKSLLVK